ncbi:hypothetical protein C1752_02353 [Acaryochloris thomasi RCC1774]|uniref:Uncharacterized protein n=1 Tax=Acaryochloris thomasi RCC1774 TaxID=1764569 RepID=A0A2W1JX73_9CYAN|nr:hypothetical protein [Acaryochloris thomasi]PZD73261.1 hypothetical protein C1752_02353 [Acaryochloris thomasi RCC1774]
MRLTQIALSGAAALACSVITQATVTDVASAATPKGVSVTMKELKDTVSKPHEISPIPSVPANWNFARYPKPSIQKGTLDRGPGPGYSQFNPWNHIDSVKGKAPANTRVQMGDLVMAIYKNGKWHEKNFGPPCNAVTFSFGKLRARNKNAAKCSSGYANAGINLYTWKDPKQHTHGWSKGRAQHNSKDVKYIMVWGTARTAKVNPNKSANLNGGHYQYGIGADKRNPSLVGKVIPPVTHGRRKLINSKWQVYLAHTMSPNTLKKLCQQKKLPPSLPFKGSCN